MSDINKVKNDLWEVANKLSEEELVIFDILTKPEPKLSKSEIEAVKLVAKELLNKLKKERLIFDWRKKQSTRAKVISTIEEVCDKLPDTYNPEIFKAKCDNLYVHLYDNYPNNQHRMSY